MIISSIILNFIKSKYFFIFIIISLIASYIGFLNIKLNIKYKETEKLKSEIANLQETNFILNKDINFKQKQLYILEAFTNSDEAIKNIKNKQLSDDSINAINTIINDYYQTLKLQK